MTPRAPAIVAGDTAAPSACGEPGSWSSAWRCRIGGIGIGVIFSLPLDFVFHNILTGAIRPERLQVGEECAWFTCDGACRTKIGISPRRARNVVGSWDPDARVLTVVTFNLPGAAHRLPYVNSQWEIQKDPYGGDVVNSYNDGRDPITGTVLGPFYDRRLSCLHQRMRTQWRTGRTPFRLLLAAFAQYG